MHLLHAYMCIYMYIILKINIIIKSLLGQLENYINF